MAYTQAGATDTVRVTLLDPNGRFIANSRPQGADPNYANIDVRNPAAGTWTAVLYSVAGAAGFKGNLSMRFDTQQAVVAGSVTPHVFTLNPGASRTVSATFTLPAQGGDTDYSVTLGSSDGQKASVSAVLQTLIDTSAGGAFSGTITGGNARAVSPAETYSYGFGVASGKTDMSVSMHLTDAEDVVDAVLLAPNGELADVGSATWSSRRRPRWSRVRRSSCSTATRCPAAGNWSSSCRTRWPATRSTSRTAERSRSAGCIRPRQGLPNSSATVIPNGHTITAHVWLKNTGVAPIAVGADPRLNQQATVALYPIQGQETVSLPDNGSDTPVYLVPPDTSNFTVATVSSLPAQVEIQGSAAGFDVFGDLQSAQSGSTVSVASVSEAQKNVAMGIWFANISEIGPFSDDGQPSGSSTFSATMRGAAFDKTVTTSVGDPYDASVNRNGDMFGNPMILKPGERKQFAVQIKVQGKVGSVVAGHLNLVTPSTLPTGSGGLPFYTTGESMTSIPYSYKIG